MPVLSGAYGLFGAKAQICPAGGSAKIRNKQTLELGQRDASGCAPGFRELRRCWSCHVRRTLGSRRFRQQLRMCISRPVDMAPEHLDRRLDIAASDELQKDLVFLSDIRSSSGCGVER